MPTCLLVDDDDDDQEIFNLALEDANPGMNCVTAKDGIEALTLLKVNFFTPDYIFLDLNMPLMDGKECLREIRKLKHLTHVPVIIFSTSSAQRDVTETKELGATSFITKPPLVSILAQKLNEVFQSKHIKKINTNSKISDQI